MNGTASVSQAAAAPRLHGNYYALAVTERLGLEDKGGMVRIGAVHYNTVEEVCRLVNALRTIES
jgi:selenocysteine lyase/cysteine desulfurase